MYENTEMSSIVNGNEAKNIVYRMEEILERFEKNPSIYEISGIPIYIYLDSLSTRINNIILYQDNVFVDEDIRWHKEYKEIMKDPTGLLKRMRKFECGLFNPLPKIEDEVIQITFDIIQNKKLNTLKLGFRFKFQAKDKSLTDEEISEIMDKLISDSLALDGASIEGL